VTHRDVKPGNVLLERAAGLVLLAGLVALSLTAHLVARVVPPARPRRYLPVELRAMGWRWVGAEFPSQAQRPAGNFRVDVLADVVARQLPPAKRARL